MTKESAKDDYTGVRMLSFELSGEIRKKLDRLAQETKRTKKAVVEIAISKLQLRS